MARKLIYNNEENFGRMGDVSPLRLITGEYLQVGDVVSIYPYHSCSDEHFVCFDGSTYFVMGIKDSWNNETNELRDEWKIKDIKIINKYYDVKDNYTMGCIKIINEDITKFSSELENYETEELFNELKLRKNIKVISIDKDIFCLKIKQF